MTSRHRRRGLTLVATVFLASPALALSEKEGGGLLGWVENTQGVPVAGAVISIFGKGIHGGALVTQSDSAGQFFLPSLPAGSYTLRALGRGHQPAPARTVTVLPHQDSIFTVSLKPEAGQASAAKATADGSEAGEPSVTSDEAEARRELRWLVRHKRRSILEYLDHEPAADGPDAPSDSAPYRADLGTTVATYMPSLAGTFEVVTTPALIGEDGAVSFADGMPTSQGVLKLHGKFADLGEWRLGGLVTEAEGAVWRMAAEFVLVPGAGHEIQTGGGYGTRYVRPLAGEGLNATLDARSSGSMFARDSWKISEDWTASYGARYSYIGFLQSANHLDGFVTVERAVGQTGRLRASYATKTLAPGGDLLTLSTLATAPVLSLARVDEQLRAERSTRYEVGVERSEGPATLGAFVFREATRDQLVNVHGGPSAEALRIVNGGNLALEGLGLTLNRRFGNAVSGSVAYSFGRAVREETPPGIPGFSADFRESSYHDVVARVETFIDLTDTRLSAYYRVNTLDNDGDARGGTIRNARFDIRLTQGLPFLQPLTRADWELLLAVRNLFYDDFEGATLDEMAVVHPPKRVMGGFAVKF
ncbi:MAG TPA: TonB-dependent receptor [Vicinamibacteria bacterium]